MIFYVKRLLTIPKERPFMYFIRICRFQIKKRTHIGNGLKSFVNLKLKNLPDKVDQQT